MDLFAIFATLWLVSATIATVIGSLRGKPGEALTIGVLLGPIGLVLTVAFLVRLHHQEPPVLLKFGEASRPERKTTDPEQQLRRAA